MIDECRMNTWPEHLLQTWDSNLNLSIEKTWILETHHSSPTSDWSPISFDHAYWSPDTLPLMSRIITSAFTSPRFSPTTEYRLITTDHYHHRLNIPLNGHRLFDLLSLPTENTTVIIRLPPRSIAWPPSLHQLNNDLPDTPPDHAIVACHWAFFYRRLLIDYIGCQMPRLITADIDEALLRELIPTLMPWDGWLLRLMSCRCHWCPLRWSHWWYLLRLDADRLHDDLFCRRHWWEESVLRYAEDDSIDATLPNQ